eukprot:8848048-Lingulodinium_polyedra.AAC.1
MALHALRPRLGPVSPGTPGSSASKPKWLCGRRCLSRARALQAPTHRARAKHCIKAHLYITACSNWKEPSSR